MTITYQVMNQELKPWGRDLTAKFDDDETGATTFKTFRFDGVPTVQEIETRMDHAIYNVGFCLNPLNGFDLGANFMGILINLIKYIRNHQDCTVLQLKTAAETAYPDMLWKGDRLIDSIKEELKAHYGFVPTFDQFKTYVITHRFRGVD